MRKTFGKILIALGLLPVISVISFFLYVITSRGWTLENKIGFGLLVGIVFVIMGLILADSE